MSSETTPMQPASPGPEQRVLQRRLGLWSASLAGIGVILGAGIYALVGPAAGQAGGAIWLAFLVAALIAGLTGYSYARFVAIVPKNSPEFQYVSVAFGPIAGFATGWLMVWSDLIAMAAVSIGFAGYLAHLAPVPVMAGALLLVALLSLIAYRGIGESVGLVMLFTLVEAGGLLFIIAVGLPYWGDVDYLEMPRGIGGVWTASALVFFAYLGFDEFGNLAEETRAPERTLPRAIVISMVVSTLMYIAVGISVVSVAGWQDPSSSSAPLARIAGTVLGPRADLILSLIALAATANTVLLLMVAASRSLYGMASAGALPGWLARVGRRHTPWMAIGITSLVAMGITFVGSIERVAQMTNASVLLSFAVVNLALFWWTARRKEAWTLKRVLSGALPPLAATATCLWLLVYTGTEAILLAVGVGALGLLIGLRRWKPRGDPGQGKSGGMA
ncbi:MAG: hypothetical protein HW388_1462 [Dehalococcoidia bacterium]|nr:hypothetical protein [Dehalococcoidia bacterium]